MINMQEVLEPSRTFDFVKSFNTTKLNFDFLSDQNYSE